MTRGNDLPRRKHVYTFNYVESSIIDLRMHNFFMKGHYTYATLHQETYCGKRHDSPMRSCWTCLEERPRTVPLLCFFQCLVAFQYVRRQSFTRLSWGIERGKMVVLLSKYGVRLQVRTVRLLFIKQYVGFTGNDRSCCHDGHSAVVILMPFSWVWVFAVRGVVTGIRGTRMIRDPIQIVRAARNSRGGKGTEIQTRQWKIHHHVQLATKALHWRETFQI